MKKIFVNGTFDILHRGHLELLLFARAQGDFLTVAVDTDQRVNRLKGNGRPVNSCNDRLFMLQCLSMVDAVASFDTDGELVELIKMHDVMVKGSDYKGMDIIGSNVCKQIVFFDRVDEYSTTKTIQSIANR